MTPEQKAREQIDKLLRACGWEVQDYRAFNPSAARGIALREVPVTGGRCDYLLLVDRKTTAGIYKIAQPQVVQIVLPLPPLAEQTRIVAEVEQRLAWPKSWRPW